MFPHPSTLDLQLPYRGSGIVVSLLRWRQRRAHLAAFINTGPQGASPFNGGQTSPEAFARLVKAVIGICNRHPSKYRFRRILRRSARCVVPPLALGLL